jgi:hypothetical protein
MAPFLNLLMQLGQFSCLEFEKQSIRTSLRHISVSDELGLPELAVPRLRYFTRAADSDVPQLGATCAEPSTGAASKREGMLSGFSRKPQRNALDLITIETLINYVIPQGRRYLPPCTYMAMPSVLSKDQRRDCSFHFQ